MLQTKKIIKKIEKLFIFIKRKKKLGSTHDFNPNYY